MALRDLVQRVATQLAFNYEIGSPLGVGGSGVVLAVTDRNLRAQRALKISRPSPGKEELLARVLSDETETLRRLAHPNLIRIFAQGVVTEGGRDHPFYVMDFVDGVKDADDFLAQPGRTERDVIRILAGVMSAVDYIHSQDKIHMDLKPGNILVGPSGVPIISDLGFAKDLRVADGATLIGGTEGYMHPDARKFIQSASSDPNRLRGEVARADLRPAWDLFSLGKTFLKLLGVLDEHNPRVLSPYSHRYLKLLSCRLLDGHNTEAERALGLSLSTIRQIRYTNAEQVRVDLEKLSGEYNLEARIPELNPFVEKTLQASTVATTPFTERVRDILNHTQVARLGTVTQLGLLNLVYPGATHTRLEHAIGTFAMVIRYVSALYNDPLNPLFRQIMDEADLRAGLLAALLHDIGHYALAHDLEDTSRSVFSHSRRTQHLLDTDQSLRELIENPEIWNVPADRVTAILSATPDGLGCALKDRILHTLIDGPIDADKVDYITRDSRNLGLNYGAGIDIDRLLRTLTIVTRDSHGETYAAVGIHEKGKVPAESVAFARYALYAQVYWHHTYRAVKVMLHKMAWEALAQAAAADEKSKGGYEKRLREELYAFLAESSVGQEELFAATAPRATDQIQQGDLAVVQWLATHSGPAGRQLAEMITSRQIFKRILVLSQEKASGQALWVQIDEFYGHEGVNWRRKLRLQRLLQTEIVTEVEAAAGPDRPSALVSDDEKNRFLVAGRDSVIVLVDYPPRQSRPEGSLEYIVEEDRRRVRSDEMQTGSLEQSRVWSVLRENFHQSIGKLRVYAHPDHHEFLSGYLSRQQIEAALSHALTRARDDA